MIPLHPSGDTARSRTTENDHADDSPRRSPFGERSNREPAVAGSLGVHYVVPGAGSVRQFRQAAADERRVAGGGERDAGPRLDNGTTDCSSAGLSLTGARSSCVSARGAFDMVGNVYEWVADWVPRSTACGTWGTGVSPTGDDQCLAGAEATGEPGALLRGGSSVSGSLAGPLAVLGSARPSLPA